MSAVRVILPVVVAKAAELRVEVDLPDVTELATGMRIALDVESPANATPTRFLAVVDHVQRSTVNLDDKGTVTLRLQCATSAREIPR